MKSYKKQPFKIFRPMRSAVMSVVKMADSDEIYPVNIITGKQSELKYFVPVLNFSMDDNSVKSVTELTRWYRNKQLEMPNDIETARRFKYVWNYSKNYARSMGDTNWYALMIGGDLFFGFVTDSAENAYICANNTQGYVFSAGDLDTYPTRGTVDTEHHNLPATECYYETKGDVAVAAIVFAKGRVELLNDYFKQQ